MKTEYTIIVNTERYGWCLHRLAGYDKEQAERLLADEQALHPDKELALNEYTETESNNLWWNKYGTN